jgi:hypothetical protein
VNKFILLILFAFIGFSFFKVDEIRYYRYTGLVNSEIELVNSWWAKNFGAEKGTPVCNSLMPTFQECFTENATKFANENLHSLSARLKLSGQSVSEISLHARSINVNFSDTTNANTFEFDKNRALLHNIICSTPAQLLDTGLRFWFKHRQIKPDACRQIHLFLIKYKLSKFEIPEGLEKQNSL